MKKFILLQLFAVILLCSCSKTVTDVIYLQDADNFGTQDIESQTLYIKNSDQIEITVTDEKPALVAVFAQHQGDTDKGDNVYMVDNNGNITFPMFGDIKAAGFTCQQLAAQIRQRIIDHGISKNPMVSAKVVNFGITVLGEVNHPGHFDVPSCNVTLLGAIAMAGDLTITGKREKILVIREVNGKLQMKHVSLLSTDVINSPYYHLQQNDIVYVEPNNLKQKQSAGIETLKWTSGVSLFISLTYFVLRLLGK